MLVVAPTQYLVLHRGYFRSNMLQGTAFYHSNLPRHSLDAAPLAADTQFHFIPSTGNEKVYEKVRRQCGRSLCVQPVQHANTNAALYDSLPVSPPC